MKVSEDQIRKIIRESLRSSAANHLFEIFTDDDLEYRGSYDPSQLNDPEAMARLGSAIADFGSSLAQIVGETFIYFRTGQALIDAIRGMTGRDITPEHQRYWRSQIAAASLHEFLDRFGIAGLDVADIINGFLYMGEKNWKMAGLCMIAAIPVVGAGIARARSGGKFAIKASEIAALDAGVAEVKKGLRSSGMEGAEEVITEVDKIRAQMNGGKADFSDYVNIPAEMRRSVEDVAQHTDDLESAKINLNKETFPKDLSGAEYSPEPFVKKIFDPTRVKSLDEPVNVVHSTHADIGIGDLDAEIARAGKQSKSGKLKTSGLYAYETPHMNDPSSLKYGDNKIAITIPKGSKIIDVSDEVGSTSRLNADELEKLREKGIVAIKGRDFVGPPEWIIIDNSILRQNADIAAQAERAAEVVGSGRFGRDWKALGFSESPQGGSKALTHPDYPDVVFKQGKGFYEIEMAEKYPGIITTGRRSTDSIGSEVAIMEKVRPLNTVSHDDLFKAIRKDFPEIPEDQVRRFLPAPGDQMGDEFMSYFTYPLAIRSARSRQEILDMILRYSRARKQWEIIPDIEQTIATLRTLRNNRKFSQIADAARKESAYFSDIFRLDNMGLDANGNIKILDFEGTEGTFIGDVTDPPRKAGPPPIDDPKVKGYVDEIMSIVGGINESFTRWELLAGIRGAKR